MYDDETLKGRLTSVAGSSASDRCKEATCSIKFHRGTTARRFLSLKISREKKQIVKKKGKTKMEVIKLAPPTWRGIALQLLAAYRNTKNDDTLKMIEEEFLNMAKAADLFNSRGESENNG